MMLAAFAAGFVVGALVVLSGAVLAAMTPKEAIHIIKEERLKHGRQVRADQRSRYSRKI